MAINHELTGVCGECRPRLLFCLYFQDPAGLTTHIFRFVLTANTVTTRSAQVIFRITIFHSVGIFLRIWVRSNV